jgi:hypothetical protein
VSFRKPGKEFYTRSNCCEIQKYPNGKDLNPLKDKAEDYNKCFQEVTVPWFGWKQRCCFSCQQNLNCALVEEELHFLLGCPLFLFILC